MAYCRSVEEQRCRISHGKLPAPVHQQPLKSNSKDDDDVKKSGFNQDEEDDEDDVEDVVEDVDEEDGE